MAEKFRTVWGMVEVERIAAGRTADAGRVAQLTAAFRQRYTEQDHDLSRLLPGAADCLAALAQQGIRAAVCSNKPTPNCLQVLEELGIAHHFEAIQGSGDGLPLKPDPAPLNAIIDRLGVRAEATLYVGDSETDIATAANANNLYYCVLTKRIH